MGSSGSERPAAIGHYSLREVARLAGVSPRRIGSWARYGIMPRVSRKPSVYSYADAGEAVIARYLIDQGVKPKKVREMVEGLRIGSASGRWRGRPSNTRVVWSSFARATRFSLMSSITRGTLWKRGRSCR